MRQEDEECISAIIIYLFFFIILFVCMIVNRNHGYEEQKKVNFLIVWFVKVIGNKIIKKNPLFYRLVR